MISKEYILITNSRFQPFRNISVHKEEVLRYTDNFRLDIHHKNEQNRIRKNYIL